MRPSSRPTIGLFTPSTSMPWAARQWDGMVQSAKDFDVNLVSYIGGVIGSSYYNGQASVLYDLARTAKLDGLLIWSAAIGWNLNRAEMSEFFDRFRSIPCISLELELPGIPSVVMDNYHGMYQVVAHLIEEHGLRRIAFLRGSIHHEGAQDRYRAYGDCLAAHGLRLDSSLVPVSNRPWDAKAMISTLLDEHRDEFDAVVSSSDDMLIDAMTVLRDRGIRVPEDIAVAGFDNIPEGMSMTPPITTCDSPFPEIGRKGLELLMSRLGGKDIPELVTMPVRLLVRESCGCDSPVLREANREALVLGRRRLDAGASGPQEPDAEILLEALGIPRRENSPSELWAAFLDDVRGVTQARFLPLLNLRLNQVAANNGDVFEWLTTMTSLQRLSSPWLSKLPRSSALRGESLLRQGYSLVGEVAQRIQAQRKYRSDAQQSSLKSISESLITTFDRDALMDTFVRELPSLGIESCYLSLYVHPEVPSGEARLVLAYDARGRHVLGFQGIVFPASELAPAEFWTTDRRFTRVVLALYFQTENIGFVVFDLRRNEDARLCEALRWQLSSALKGSSLVQMEREFFHDQKLNSLGILAGGIAHDFNNILAIILTNTELAMMKIPEDSPAASKLQTIKKASIRATDLAKQMLMYSGRGTFQIKPLDLNRLLEEMADLLKVSLSKGSVLELRLTEPLPPVLVDATQIRQVVMNLILNASEAIGDRSGTITVGTGVGSESRVFLKISDTGSGMSDDTLSKIFDPFFTTKFTGRGLGLSAVQGIVHGHKGEIEVTSELGKGSSFVVRLPTSPELPEAKESGILDDQWQGSGTVLFVDDEPELRLVGGEIFSQLGFSVLLASNGQEALAMAKSGLPDLVVLDLTMPDMGGEECFLELRRLNPDLQVLLSSGYNEKDATARLLDRGLAGFIPKPYTIAEVRSVIQRLPEWDRKRSSS